MKFEPQKFFIGLVDFFAILLPGALLTFVLKIYAAPFIWPNTEPVPEEGEGWAIFLFVSYLLGHFIFLLGSRWLDDQIYDRLRNATRGGQIRTLAQGKKREAEFVRKMADKEFGSNMDLTLERVLAIKDHYLDPLNASEAINVFQWCKARLCMEQPEAMAVVQRFEADSKFFRSLLVVLSGLIVFWLVNALWKVMAFLITMDQANFFASPLDAISDLMLAIGALPLVYLSLWRYIEQRKKSIRQAYWYIITLESERKNGYRPKDSCIKNGFSHAGGVVYRKREGIDSNEVEYLLIKSKLKPTKSVLPKGHIEPGESIKETAVREVLEEARVWASIKKPLRDCTFIVDNQPIIVQFYLMEYLEIGGSDEDRKPQWYSLENALKEDIYPEIKALLVQASISLKERNNP